MEGPKVPVPFFSPEGVRMSLAYFSWNLMTAVRVVAPKVPESVLGERSFSLMRRSWRSLTSGPVMPRERVRENVVVFCVPRVAPVGSEVGAVYPSSVLSLVSVFPDTTP